MRASNSGMTLGRAREVLGVPPGADQLVIARAYRQAVKSAHPDLPGGDAERLRQVVDAYRLMKSLGPPLANFSLVRRPAEASRQRAPKAVAFEISIREALDGGERLLALEGGGKVKVKLPPGLRPGDAIHVGEHGSDAEVLLRVSVADEPSLSLRGHDLCLVIEIDGQASGRPLVVDTPRGPRAIPGPEAMQDGGVLRLRGQGLPARGANPEGDLIICMVARERSLWRRFAVRRAA